MGYALRVLYLADNPQESQILGGISLGTVALGYATFTFFGVMCVWASVSLISTLSKYPLDKLRHRRLKQHGVLLDGELLSAKGRMDTKHNHYHVYVTYQFQSPNGRTLKRKQSKARDDLRKTPLPVAGTHVSVLYADDDSVVML